MCIYILTHIYICMQSKYGTRPGSSNQCPRPTNGRWAEDSTSRALKVPSDPRKVDTRLPGKGNSDSHGARPVYSKLYGFGRVGF